MLREAVSRYESAHIDEDGPLSGGGLTALYRASQGLPVSRIPPQSESANETAAAFYRRLLDGLDRIDTAALSNGDTMSYLVLRSAIERALSETRYYWYVSPVTPYRSTVLQLRMIFRSFDVSSEAARAAYFSAVADAGAFVRGAREKLLGQMRRGIMLPRQAMPQILALHRAAIDANSSALLPGTGALAVLDEESRARFLDRARAAIARHVSPAIAELTEFLETAYSPAAAEGYGQSAYPGGAEYYEHCVRANTTLDVPAREIHALGLRIVAELREAMRELRSRAKIDPARFVPSSPEEIHDALDRAARRADEALHELFSRKPKAPFGVKRLSADLEGGMSFGYYDPGHKAGETGCYLFNGSNLEQRSVLSAAALAQHELVPGHHYEINMARENRDLPRFRCFQSIATYIAAYHEGWAEYASDLGKEIGLYDDPADLYGRHALDAFISSRLVVDTGLNAMNWTFERAAQYLRENTLLSEAEIQSEILRYATDLPAQGLAYKMGALAFHRLREKARTALGGAFDVRAFHDRIVSGGGMPLPLVEREVDAFVAETIS